MISSKVLGLPNSGAAEKVGGGWVILAAALALGLAGDLLLRPRPWGLNVTVWLMGLCATTMVLPRFEPLRPLDHIRAPAVLSFGAEFAKKRR